MQVTSDILDAARRVDQQNLDLGGLSNAVDDDDIASTDSRVNTPKPQQNQGLLFTDDPAMPLRNPKHERFLQALAQGASKAVAYLEHVSPMATHKTSVEQASRLLGRGDYQERLRVLIRRGQVRESGKEEGKTGENEGNWGGDLDKEGLARCVEGIVRSRSENTSDRLSAADKLVKLRGFVKDQNVRRDVPDPVYMAQFIRRAQELNKDVVELCKEAGDTLPVVAPEGISTPKT